MDRRLLGILLNDVLSEVCCGIVKDMDEISENDVLMVKEFVERLLQAQQESNKKSCGIEETLEDRAKTHGDFSKHAMISQTLKNALWTGQSWHELTDAQKESLEMCCHKMARIVNGNPHHKDHWHDLVGYAKLVDDLIEDDKQDAKS